MRQQPVRLPFAQNLFSAMLGKGDTVHRPGPTELQRFFRNCNQHISINPDQIHKTRYIQSEALRTESQHQFFYGD
jgi:hypothetical protein